ncbi:MAG: LTA synthase family protein [Leptospiraceae bacterium]|nr:LTA synthase family protein [Leptospiraceae bacterium]
MPKAGLIQIFSVYFSLLYSLSLTYRIVFWKLLNQSGPKDEIGLHNYLAGIVIVDTPMLLLLSLLIFGIFLLISRFIKRDSNLVFFLIITLIMMTIHLVASEFFKLYQTPFRLSSIRADIATTWPELTTSAFAEFNADSLLLALLQIAVAVLFYWLLLHSRKKNHFSLVVPGLTFAIFILLKMKSIDARLEQIRIDADHSLGQILRHPLVQDPGLMQRNLDQELPESVEYTDRSVFQNQAARWIPRPVRKKYNIVLYFFESTPEKYIDATINGKEITPVWNSLKKKGLYFKRHYANFPLSINAFHAAYCSAYPLPDGRWMPLEIPDLKIPCLSEVLSSAGYQTGYIMAGTLEYANQQRFMASRKLNMVLDSRKIKKGKYTEGLGPWGAADERAMIEPALKFIQKNPFFLSMYSFNPHHPYNAGLDYTNFLQANEKIQITRDNYKTKPMPEFPDPEKSRAFRDYLNSLNFSDRAMGEIINAFEKKSAPGEVIFILVGDHGEAFYEHRGNYNHPHFLYEENVHVPMLIYAPGIVQPGEVENLTSHLDIAPTIYDLVGESPPPHTQGASVFNRKSEGRTVFLHAHWDIDFLGAVDGPYKYIVRLKDKREELFNLQVDPNEKQNLALSNPTITENFYKRVLAQRNFTTAFYREIAGYLPQTGAPSAFDDLNSSAEE